MENGTAGITRITVPQTAQSDQGQGGCFGSGPGLLSATGGELVVPVDAFVASNKTYDLRLAVQKGKRTSKAEQEVRIVDGRPPIMDVR